MLTNAAELESYSKSEEDKFETMIKGLADAGIQVVVGSGSMSEMAVHFFEKYKIFAMKIMSKWELKRLARAVGATPVVKLCTPSPDDLGYANEVNVKEAAAVVKTENTIEAKRTTQVAKMDAANVEDSIGEKEGNVHSDNVRASSHDGAWKTNKMSDYGEYTWNEGSVYVG